MGTCPNAGSACFCSGICQEEEWAGFAYEVDGVKYYKHTCIRCGERWTDTWVINSYCSRNVGCKRRRAGL